MKTTTHVAPTHGNIGLHTLSVWTPLAKVMKDWFWTMNGSDQPFVKGEIWIPQGVRPYTHEQICEFAKSRGKEQITLRLGDNRQNSFTLRGAITLLIPVTINTSGWIMGIEGNIATHDSAEVPVAMPVYYDTEYGRGFCLIPEKVGYQVAGHGYSY